MDINSRLQDEPSDWSSDSDRHALEQETTRARAAARRIPRPTSRLTKAPPASQKSSPRTLRILGLLGD